MAVTEAQTVDLAAWLTAIWDEEERLAKAAFSNQEDPEHGWGKEGRAVTPHVGVIHEDVQRAHVVRWHPGAVLARIAADRKIIELHGVAWNAEVCTVCHHLIGDDLQVDNDAWPCATVRALASPYADRPGFQAAWIV
jgi:hypothetical protein